MSTHMAKMTPFEYSGFYDVPRYIRFWYGAKSYLLRCEFDDDLDDYSPEYSVFERSDSAEVDWEAVSDPLAVLIGKVDVGQVTFDPAKRKSLDASFIDSLITNHTA